MLSSVEALAFRRLGRSVDARWVDWAVSMLVEGHDTPTLCVLAGESAPFCHFEMAALVDRAFEEIGLRPFASSAEAAVALASVRARQILNGVTPIAIALREIAALCVELDYLLDIYDFYLLRHARDELREYEEQHYWPGGHRGNIDQLIRDYCRKWLGEHDSSA